MNSAAKTSARALVRANPRRLPASLPRAVARRRLQSAAAALPSVTTRDFFVALSLSRSVLLRLFSYARVLLVLAPAEVGGIRYTRPPM